MFRDVKWKRNFARAPTDLKDAVAKFKSDLFVVARTKKVPVADIEAGVYVHIGLVMKDGAIAVADPPVVPPADMGKWSDRNRNGWENKRRDLPKITKTFTWESPNWGDAYNGTHTQSQDREVYQVEYYEPRHYAVVAEVMQQPTAAGVALVKFSVDTILNRKHPSLDYDFMLCVNLLQENAGVAGVFASDATREEYIGTIQLDWQVFPPGTAEAVVASFLKGKKPLSAEKLGIVEARVKLFNSLKPKAIIRGHGGFAAYVGAQFDDDLVVFENLNWGNALYVLYDNWVEVSKRSRIDLIKGTSVKFDRFIHTEGWEDRFEEHMKDEIKKRSARKR
jgi:hypothetical protein